MDNELMHYGVLGMKWGHHKVKENNNYYKENTKTKIIKNKDGSFTVPKNFIFNRVGHEQLDVNKAGGLYVSYGKKDASRYIKNLGPTPINKLFKQAHTTVQHIKVKEKIKSCSEEETGKIMLESLIKNDKILKTFNKSIFSAAASNDFEKNYSKEEIKSLLKNNKSKDSKRVQWAVCGMLADPNYVDVSKNILDNVRKKGYDAMPDIYDKMSGTSETAMLIVNPNKISITSTTNISKYTLKDAKRYVKEIGKLPVDEAIK